MKTPSLAVLNSIGFTNTAQKILYAAHLLQTASLSSPAGIARAASAFVTAKPEVQPAPAYPARPASILVPASANPGYAAGALFLDSPAYPANTPIPPIPLKPPSPARAYSPAVPAVSAVTAVNTPATTGVSTMENLVYIGRDVSNQIQVNVTLPVLSSVALAGILPDKILEFTDPKVQPTEWLDTPASYTPTTSTEIEPPTVEEYFYKQVRELVGNSNNGVYHIIRNGKYQINNTWREVKIIKIKLGISGVNFAFQPPTLYLDKVFSLTTPQT